MKQRTQLDWRRLLHALTILIQQQLVFWYTHEDGYTTYEANLKASLALVKVGSYVAPIQERFGSLELKIISELALLGYATVNDILQAVLETDRIGISDEGKGRIASSQVEKSGQNSANETRVLHGVRQAMLKLAKEGVLKAVNASHFRSPEDNSTEAERKLPPRGPLDNALKKGEQNDYDQKVMKTLEDWRQGTRELREEMGRFKTGDKRPHDGTEPKQTSKKRKTEVIAQGISVYNQEISESFSVRCAPSYF